MAAFITPEELIAGLIEYDLVTQEQIVRTLGAARATITINALETAIARDVLVSNEQVLQIKGTLSGFVILDDPSIAVNTLLPSAVALGAGALLLELSTRVVVMVEPTEENIDVVVQAMGTRDFEIWLTTATGFQELYESAYRRVERGSRLPLPKDIYEVLTAAIQRDASDIHLAVDEPPLLRQNGGLTRLRYSPLDIAWMDEELPKLVSPERYATLAPKYDIDAAIDFGTSRFRINIGADFRGPTVALRKIPVKIPTFDELHLPKAIRDLVELERGMVLITGPTGSGKSTTLASMLAHIAANTTRHIITLEDPIEYHIPSGTALVNQRELYESFTAFDLGLRQALRNDPDVVLVGEMRDTDTIRTAMLAAETGHLVFGTLHTYDTVATVSRIISTFPAAEQDHIRGQLAYILKGIVSQTLLPLASTSGRVAAFEIMLATPAITANLRKSDGHNQLRQVMEVARKEGMQTMEVALATLVKTGLISEATGEFAAANTVEFHRQLRLHE
jgi:twitching motility protein PilT